MISLITVGDYRDNNLEHLETGYRKRIRIPFSIHPVKTFAEDLKKESEVVMKKIQDLEKKYGKARVITLKEKGKIPKNSKEFSQSLFSSLESFHHLVFVIGGASGHGNEVLGREDDSLSLSGLTYPHKLARLLFVEQIYRAETIRQGHPYHK